MNEANLKPKLCDLLGICLVAMLFILVGATAMYFSLNEYCSRKHIIDHGVRTEAIVLDAMQASTSKKRHKSGTRVRVSEAKYYLDLSFTDTQGRTQRVQSTKYDYRERGSKVQIAHLEENPQQFEIIPPQGMTLLLIIAGGGAFFCLIATCVVIAEIRRHMKKR